VEWYGRRLSWILDHQRLTLYVWLGTLILTGLLYVWIPKGFFPTQDTGLIQGVSEAAEAVSYAAMAERQQALAAAILKDPDVASLSSFIGVDGSNVTLNSGRVCSSTSSRASARSATAAADHPPAAGRDRRRGGHRSVHAAGAGSDPG
jgi:multidrug efflux pump